MVVTVVPVVLVEDHATVKTVVVTDQMVEAIMLAPAKALRHANLENPLAPCTQVEVPVDTLYLAEVLVVLVAAEMVAEVLDRQIPAVAEAAETTMVLMAATAAPVS